MKCEWCDVTHEQRLRGTDGNVVWHDGGFVLPGLYCSKGCWDAAMQKAERKS